MRWSIRNFDTSPLLPNGHLIVVCSRGVEGCDPCVDGVGHLSWTSVFQAEYVFYHVIWGCSRKEFTFARRGLWRKGLQESRNRQSDLMAFSDLEEWNIKIFQKNNTVARAPTLPKKPYGASWRGRFLRSRDQLLWVVMFVSVVITYYPSH